MTKTSNGLVVFVCPHGVGKSRMAAALFEASCQHLGLADWSVTSAAGEEPGDALSPHAIRLLAGTPAEGFLRPGPALPLDKLMSGELGADRVLVVGIDLDPTVGPIDRDWRLLVQDPDDHMRAEIGAHVGRLVAELAG